MNFVKIFNFFLSISGYSVVRRNRLIQTIPILPRGWSLGMEIRPTGKIAGWGNIFHATIGNDGVRVGDR